MFKVCYNDNGFLGQKEERNVSIFRTIALFIYLFGYMIVHYGVLRRGERALAAGDMDTVEAIVNKHIPHWSRGILKVTGAPVVPVAISGARGLFEAHGNRATPGSIHIRILPPIQTTGMSKAEQKQLPEAVRQTILAQL